MSNSKIIGGTGGPPGGGSGTITATPPVTDNAIVRWDGTTATIIQNSIPIVQDGGAIQSRGFITNRVVDTTVAVGSTETWIAPSLEIASGGVITLASGAQLIII